MINFHGEGEKEKDRKEREGLKKLWRVAEEKKIRSKNVKGCDQRRDRIYNLFPHTV